MLPEGPRILIPAAWRNNVGPVEHSPLSNEGGMLRGPEAHRRQIKTAREATEKSAEKWITWLKGQGNNSSEENP